MSKAMPYIKFYGRDWLGDHLLRMVSPEVRGVWIDMLSAMSMSEPYGYLAAGGRPMDDSQAARMVGMPVEAYQAALAQIEAVGIASRTPDGFLYSRRLVRDHSRYTEASAYGKQGGNPALRSPPVTPLEEEKNTKAISQKPEATLSLSQGLSLPLTTPLRVAKTFKRPTVEELAEYASSIDFKLDPQAFLDHYDSNGWKVGKAAMKDWQATVRKWKRTNAQPQRQNGQGGKKPLNTWVSEGPGQHDRAF